MTKTKTSRKSPKASKSSAALYASREEWLNALVEEMRPVFLEAGCPIPEKVRVTMSLTRKTKAIGTCFDKSMSKDKHYEILIRLDQAEASKVAEILCHELCHAAVGTKAGHRGAFKSCALAVGLTGKMTATVAGDYFVEWSTPILAKLGSFPHATLNLSKVKKQGTRLLKVECQDCGYIARVTAKWLGDLGAPICPCNHEPMAVCD